jgi:hypothetical protein
MSAWAYVNTRMGRLFRRMGHHVKAERLARKVLGVFPDYAPAWRLLGIELASRVDESHRDEHIESEAENAFRRAHALRPDDYYTTRNLVCLLGWLGKTEEACLVADCFVTPERREKAELQEVARAYTAKR